MGNVNDELYGAYDSIKDRIKNKPEVALVLGSGLGDFANIIEDKIYITYEDIKGFPLSTVSGHAGTYVLGHIGNVSVVAMQGRVHYYEGYSMNKVVMPIRLMKLMGADKLILTNAAGGINVDFVPGDLMMIKDHITSFVPSPLIGLNISSLGTRFPDMSHVYDIDMQKLMTKTASELDIPLKTGVYLQTTGPNYETPVEIRMYRGLGADAVGMSTACEAMAAMHMGMKIAGVSCITNLAAGMSNDSLNHNEVKETANSISGRFESLIKNFIVKLI